MVQNLVQFLFFGWRRSYFYVCNLKISYLIKKRNMVVNELLYSGLQLTTTIYCKANTDQYFTIVLMHFGIGTFIMLYFVVDYCINV